MDLVDKVARAIWESETSSPWSDLDQISRDAICGEAQAAIAVVLRDLLAYGCDEDCIKQYAKENKVKLR